MNEEVMNHFLVRAYTGVASSISSGGMQEVADP